MDDFPGCCYFGYYYCACCYWDYLGFLGLFYSDLSFFTLLRLGTFFSSFDTIFDAFLFLFFGIELPTSRLVSFLLALH